MYFVILYVFYIHLKGCVVTEAELQEIQVEVEDVEHNIVPLGRFVEYMCKAITERRYILMKSFLAI